jgi:hypothetical protein
MQYVNESGGVLAAYSFRLLTCPVFLSLIFLCNSGTSHKPRPVTCGYRGIISDLDGPRFDYRSSRWVFNMPSDLPFFCSSLQSIQSVNYYHRDRSAPAQTLQSNLVHRESVGVSPAFVGREVFSFGK